MSKENNHVYLVIYFTQVNLPPPLVGGGEGEGDAEGYRNTGGSTPTLTLPHQGGGNILEKKHLTGA